MAIFLINGLSGTGKTTIGIELARRGYHAIDTDKAFGYYGDLKTEEPVDFPGKDVQPEWYDKNGWIWNRDSVDQVINTDETIFFCGGSSNEFIFYPGFNKIFHLYVNPETLVKRLRTRDGDRHPNNPEYIVRMLELLESSNNDAKSQGWILIDTSDDSVEQSTDLILSFIKN